MILESAALILSGYLDRLRGDAKHILGYRVFDKIALGYVMAVLAGFPFDPVVTPSIILAMTLGMSFGWGCPLGHALNGYYDGCEYEWWQKGILKKKPYLALSVRGMLWGLPVAAVGLVLNIPVLFSFILAYAIAMPLAAKVAVMMDKGTSWEMQELYRGHMAALVVYLFHKGLN